MTVLVKIAVSKTRHNSVVRIHASNRDNTFIIKRSQKYMENCDTYSK